MQKHSLVSSLQADVHRHGARNAAYLHRRWSFVARQFHIFARCLRKTNVTNLSLVRFAPSLSPFSSCLMACVQVIQAFRNVPIEKINDYLGGDSAHRIIFDFFNSSDTPAIFFRETRNSIEVSDVPTKQKGQLLYFVKLVKTQISETKIANEVIVGDIYTDPLEHLAVLSEKIYHPIVASKETGQVWSEAIAKEVRDNFDTFVANVQITQGHVRGVTCLPIPGSEAAKIDADIPLDQDHSYQVHALEGAIITWTKQIKNILKQDPESVFQIHTNPGPLCEIEFWTSKAGNLNGIFDQLQSVRVRRVLKILDKSKSTYNQPFAKLCKEVFHARAEVLLPNIECLILLRPTILSSIFDLSLRGLKDLKTNPTLKSLSTTSDQ